MASALRSRFSSFSFGASAWLDVAGSERTRPPASADGTAGAAASDCTATTEIVRPAIFDAAASSHARVSSSCSRSARCVGRKVNVTRSGVTSIFCACATTVP